MMLSGVPKSQNVLKLYKIYYEENRKLLLFSFDMCVCQFLLYKSCNKYFYPSIKEASNDASVRVCR